MSWFSSKSKQPIGGIVDLPAPTVALLDDPADVAWRRQEQQAQLERHHVDFEPKPADLVAAVERSQAPKPEDEAPLRVAWTREPPSRAGLYWWVARAPQFDGQAWEPRLALVLAYGGRLCVRRRRGPTSTFTSVATLERMWAGPVATPLNAELEDLRLEIV
jgi:hypothetical protein